MFFFKARRRRGLEKRLFYDHEEIHREAKRRLVVEDHRVLAARLHRQAIQISRAQLVYQLFSHVRQRQASRLALRQCTQRENMQPRERRCML